jgi:molecular chaperone DnaK
VLQGERQRASDNKSLGRFDLTDIPPAPRGVPQIEVAFDIDANGIVHVSAKDLGTGKEQKIRIESSSGLSDTEIEKMVKEAELNAEEDKQVRDRAEARNEADTLVYSTEKSLAEYGDKLSADERSAVATAVADVKSYLQANEPEAVDVEVLKAKTETLRQAAYKLAEEMYKNAQGGASEGDAGAQPGANGTATDADGAGENGRTAAASKGEKVEDVDYEVVDDDDKK